MPTAEKLKPNDYKTGREPIWCPGCGDFGALNAFYQALSELEVEPHMLALFSGIGCSSRLPYFVNGYCHHGVHGRALPAAMGAKLSNPELTVVVTGGDGDGFSIGTGHVPHIVRRNPDITYIMLDNEIYGLTKGQIAPTSPVGMTTSSTPLGSLEDPLNPVALLIACNASFVARGFSGDPKGLKDLFVKAISHPGFAFVDVLSPCPTFNMDMTYQSLRPKVSPLPEDHDSSDRVAAFARALEPVVYTGVFYHRRESIPYEKRHASLRAKQVEYGGQPDLAALIRKFR
ncbi:MAG: 2-oxoacid:ferredoxin oxidoreductase subunit beta [Candidatus Sumerlaeia bacterium]|nr:2-oxoacid:ferredoxin oxidoreductase subunit beta [Candidatus Sumerlaeia bacterium]